MMLLHNKLLRNIIKIGHALLIENIRKDLDNIRMKIECRPYLSLDHV